ncbi:MAG: protein kinase [Deltaproteobacteria bacterium]|nr:protein kinase [Deltaproteobacteria bacterium]
MQEPGDFVTPTLRLSRRLGAGGMGTVWVARHVGLNCDVVVKFITGDLANNADAVARFQREAAAASEVRSPHVVQMLDHGISQRGLPYIAMELLEGEDLAARLSRVGPMAPAEVAGVVVQVARALGRAHDKGIVHRDIKPENIFLCETGEDEAFVKVLDFGIAKVVRADAAGATSTGAVIGSPYWMSPEQLMGSKALDARTDLWSLGAVAYIALTGRRPFDGETLAAIAVQICSTELPVPSRAAAGLSPAIDAWFARACARDPKQRFPTARALAEAFVAATGGAHVSSSSSSSAGEAARLAVTMPLGSSSAGEPPRAGSTTRVQTFARTMDPGDGEALERVVPPRRPGPFVWLGVAALLAAAVGVWVSTRPPAPPATSADPLPAAASDPHEPKVVASAPEITTSASSIEPKTVQAPIVSEAKTPEKPATNPAKPAAAGSAKPIASVSTKVPSAHPTVGPKPPVQHEDDAVE